MGTTALSITLHRTSDADRREARHLQRLAKAGALTRVRRGVFAEPTAVERLDARGRHLLEIRAALPRVPLGAALSHLSAVAAQGWPHIGRWPERIHVTADADRSTLHRDRMTVHRGRPGPPQPTSARFEGTPVLHPAGVAVDLALVLPFHESLVIVDHLLRVGLVTREQLDAELERVVGKGRTRAEAVLGAANAIRESVGESYCAARLRQIGAPVPREQVELRDGAGRTYRVDFWMEELGVVLEFDGREKYENESMLAGRTPQEVLWAEKRREDRIRALPGVNRFVRVTWWHLVDPDRLRALLREHGIPC